MTNALITLDDGKTVELPAPLNDGANSLFKPERANRLPQWLPAGVVPRQFMMAIAAEANKPGLRNCAPESIVAAAFNCAVVGLIPGDIQGHAHLVPFKGKCQLIIGYKGFLELSYGCDFLRDVHCEVVLKGEKFERWNDGDGPQLRHEMTLDRDLEWANVLGSYCIWHSRGGGRGLGVVGLKELRKLKQRGNVWDSNPIAQAMKTPIRRQAKLWQQTVRLGAAVTLDGLAEAGQPQPAPAGMETDEPAPGLEAFAAKEPPAEPVDEPPTEGEPVPEKDRANW